MQAVMKPELIEKETISNLSFSSSETVQQHPDLLNQIEQATILGNSHHSKVSIIFQDDSGLNAWIQQFGQQELSLFVLKEVFGFQSLGLLR